MISSEVVVILRKMMLRPLVLFLLFSLLNAHLLRKAFAAHTVALTTEVAALAAFAIEAEVTALKGRKSSTTLSLGHTKCGSKSGPHFERRITKFAYFLMIRTWIRLD